MGTSRRNEDFYMSDTNKTVSRKLPATVAGLRVFNPEASQKIRLRNLIDEVQELHDELWEDDENYRLLFEAISNAGTQEGTLAADGITAADRIRRLARDEKRNEWVGLKKLAEIH